jgi:hypothetical protein
VLDLPGVVPKLVELLSHRAKTVQYVFQAYKVMTLLWISFSSSAHVQWMEGLSWTECQHCALWAILSPGMKSKRKWWFLRRNFGRPCPDSWQMPPMYDQLKLSCQSFSKHNQPHVLARAHASAAAASVF